MKSKCRIKKVLLIFLLLVIFISVSDFTVVKAEVNKQYSLDATSGSIDIDKAVKEAKMLEYVAHFIYGIAGFLEDIFAKIIGAFTGTKMFPWSDRIIFNTIPFLDVNFLSPSEGSMFLKKGGTDTIFGEIVKNLYYTIFVLATSFFGVVVGVMAIKLAISTIASEKAQYKKAIQNWLLALILLFITHYLIAFIFYVNEKMVEVASSMLKQTVEKVSYDIDANSYTDEECAQIVENLMSNAWFKQYSGENNDRIVKFPTSSDPIYTLTYEIKKDDKKIDIKGDVGKTKLTKDELEKKINRNIAVLLSNPDYLKYRTFNDKATTDTLIIGGLQDLWATWSEFVSDTQTERITPIFDDAVYMTLNQISDVKAKKGDIDNFIQVYGSLLSSQEKKAEMFDGLTKAIYNISTGAKNDIFTSMGDFFRNSVYQFERDNTGEITSAKAENFSPLNGIMYAIFVVQSLMFFVAYIKRFFYIIVLALFAPIVILYDFLTKSVAI